jgi:hypothetical protein
MNAHIRNVEYAVRGELAIKAETLKKQLNSNKSLPFETIVNCNIGNPQQLEQKPITFFRQVRAHLTCSHDCHHIPALLTPPYLGLG